VIALSLRFPRRFFLIPVCEGRGKEAQLEQGVSEFDPRDGLCLSRISALYFVLHFLIMRQY